MSAFSFLPEEWPEEYIDHPEIAVQLEVAYQLKRIADSLEEVNK